MLRKRIVSRFRSRSTRRVVEHQRTLRASRPKMRQRMRPKTRIVRPRVSIRSRIRPRSRVIKHLTRPIIPKLKIPALPPPTPVAKVLEPVTITKSTRRENIVRTWPDDVTWLRSIGTPLTQPLNPNLIKTNLFDKTYRMDILTKYIDKNGSNVLPCPFSNMFAISIRPERFASLQTRLGVWSANLQCWTGTIGATLNKNDWVQTERAVDRLTRGQIGCYDSHYRLWKHIIENNLPEALILEDDADINYGQYTVTRVQMLFKELKQLSLEYDLLYLGHNNYKAPRKIFGSCIGVPAGVQGLFMYFITQQGAQKLMEKALPIVQPVDDYAFVQLNHVRQYTLEPRLGWVVPVQSDTSNIV